MKNLYFYKVLCYIERGNSEHTSRDVTFPAKFGVEAELVHKSRDVMSRDINNPVNFGGES